MQVTAEHVIARIDGYLAGRVTAEEASDWALKALIQDDFDDHPSNIGYAIVLLCDLDDEGQPWYPTVEELKEAQRLLLEGQDPPVTLYWAG